jgi:hypothetical protein
MFLLLLFIVTTIIRFLSDLKDNNLYLFILFFIYFASIDICKSEMITLKTDCSTFINFEFNLHEFHFNFVTILHLLSILRLVSL